MPLRPKKIVRVSGLGHAESANGNNGVLNRLKFGAGLAGFCKTLAKEYKETKVISMDVDRTQPAKQIAEQIITELKHGCNGLEVHYNTSARILTDVSAEPLTKNGVEFAPFLNRESTILITGGMKGVTAKCAIRLAQEWPCRFIMVGRSQLPFEEEPSQYHEAYTLAELRGIVSKESSELKLPEIDSKCRKILNERTMRQTLRAIQDTGSTVEYHTVDVKNEAAFADLIDNIYQRGTLTGVIHGAGIIEDKLMKDKTKESFERVFLTKVQGALTLAKKCREDLKFMVFFSSISGAFGNKGQIDYSTANDFLDKLAVQLNRERDTRVVSINWGPWAGGGMVSPELEREYARQGMGLIPEDAGTQALIDELQFGAKSVAQVVWMASNPETLVI